MNGARQRLGLVTPGVVDRDSSNKLDPITTASQFTITPLKALLSVKDMLELLQIDRRTLERMRSAGAFPVPDMLLGNVGEKGQPPRFPRWRAETIVRWLQGGGQ